MSSYERKASIILIQQLIFTLFSFPQVITNSRCMNASSLRILKTKLQIFTQFSQRTAVIEDPEYNFRHLQHHFTTIKQVLKLTIESDSIEIC